MKFIKNNKGFTVLELVAVSAIMVFLLILFLANFRGFDNQVVLENETNKLVSILKQAQVMALTGQTVGSERYNYGVHLEECVSGSCEYVLFRVAEGQERLYSQGEAMVGGNHTIVEGVYIETLTPAISNSLDVVFEAPLGDIYFNNSVSDIQANITLKHNIYEGEKIIDINLESWQIDVQ